MRIIDFHTHTFPDELAAKALEKLVRFAPQEKACIDGTVGGLIASMDRAGIDRAVTLPIATKPSQVEPINTAAIALLANRRVIPFGTLHPAYERMEQEIGRLRESGVRGIKLHPEYQDFYIDDRTYFPMYDMLRSAGLIVLFHAGKDPGPFTSDHALPAAIRTVHDNFPSLRIVAAHMGGWRVWPQVEEALAGVPLYIDTAAVCRDMAPADFVRIARAHGVHRVLFATDSPWFDQKATVEWVDGLPLTPAEKRRIFHANAAHLLGADA